MKKVRSLTEMVDKFWAGIKAYHFLFSARLFCDTVSLENKHSVEINRPLFMSSFLLNLYRILHLFGIGENEVRNGAHVSQRFSEKARKQQKGGQRKWKVDFFTSNPPAVVAQKAPSVSTLHLFYQLACLISRNLVNSAAKRFHSDKFCHNLDTWTHLTSLIFCHLADCQSRRDICKGMRAIRDGLNHLGIQRAPSRNALSHQNARRDALVFREIYWRLHLLLGQHPYTGRFSQGIKAFRIMLLDSSVITLCLSSFNWAHSQLWRDWDSRGISFVVRLCRDVKWKCLEAFE